MGNIPYIWILTGKNMFFLFQYPSLITKRQDRVVPLARSKFLQKLLQCDLQIMEAYCCRWAGYIMKHPLKKFSWLVGRFVFVEKRMDRPSLKSQY